MKKIYFAVIALIALASAVMAGTLSINAENDYFAPNNTDKFYTHGSRISYLSDSTNSIFMFSDKILFGDINAVEYSIGQYMYTPDDIGETDLQVGERPYAGVSYTEIAQIKYDDKQYSRIGYLVGTTGPNSFSEESQTIIHHAFGNQLPEGWDNQIENEPILNVQYTYKYKVVDGKWYDVVPRTVGALGNADIFAGVGADFRVGYNMNAWEYSVMEPVPRNVSKKDFSCFLLVGAEGRYVARNITLDGNTFENSYSVEKKDEVADLYIGTGVRYKDFTVEYKFNYRTKEFDGQEKPEEFGTIAIRFDV